jgi:uncharacterized membrane protein YjjP (DUF1212 family)
MKTVLLQSSRLVSVVLFMLYGMSICMNDLTAWYCCLIAFGLHLIVHIIQFLVIRKYIPVIVTSVLCLPYCIWVFIQVKDYYTLNETLLRMKYSITNIVL